MIDDPETRRREDQWVESMRAHVDRTRPQPWPAHLLVVTLVGLLVWILVEQAIPALLDRDLPPVAAWLCPIVAGAIALFALRWDFRHGRLMTRTTAVVGAILLELALLIGWIIATHELPYSALGIRTAGILILVGLLAASIRAWIRANRSLRR